MNNVYLLVGIVVGLLAIAGYLRTALRNEVRSVIKEVTPNGGGSKSLGDTAKRTEEKIGEHAALDLKVQRKQNKKIKVLTANYAALSSQVQDVLNAVKTPNGDTIGELVGMVEERHLREVERSETAKGKP